MTTIAQALTALELGPPASFRNLSVFPLLNRSGDAPDYLTLDEALAAGRLRVTEIDAGGSVPELKLTNEGDRPVLLLDGEELVGAKQNRVLNLTILAPAGRTIVIPVSCVEAGRWRYSGAAVFDASPHLMYSRARGHKAAQVSLHMAQAGSPRSDQSAVWNEIACRAADLDADSPTQAMREIYKRHETTIEDYVEAFPYTDDQIGGLFAIDGRVVGLELLDWSETMHKLWPKLVRSYALDVIGSPDVPRQPPTSQSAQDFVEEVAAAETRATQAVGLGQDVRLSGRGLAGGALVHNGRLVHLSAFRLEEEAGSGGGRGRSRMQSFSQRIRRRRAG
jgi:hypothetical protein